MSLIGCFSIYIFYIWLDIHQCCPTGFTWCANEYGYCSVTGTNVIAYGQYPSDPADNLGGRFNYKKKIGSFDCDDSDGDSVFGRGKECCYQNDIIYNVPSSIESGVDWSAGELQCNTIQYGWLAGETEAHIWKFTIYNELRDVRFDNCGSDDLDLQLYLYDSSGTQIAGCDNCGSCGTAPPYLSDFTATSLSAGTYWVKILPYDMYNRIDAGYYQLQVTCPDYGGVLTCSQNTISGTTTESYPYAKFSVITKSKHDIEVNSCDTSFSTLLYIYSDSTFTTLITGGNNNACASGHQEIYYLNGQNPGTVYVKLDRYSTGPDYLGPYIVSIVCRGNYPTAQPTPSPTNEIPPSFLPTTNPTFEPTGNPTLQPTLERLSPTFDPTNDPTLIPTADPTTNPTKNPTTLSKSPTTNPTKIPTKSPTLNPTISPTPTLNPTISPTPTLNPTIYPTIPTLNPNIATSTSDPTTTTNATVSPIDNNAININITIHDDAIKMEDVVKTVNDSPTVTGTKDIVVSFDFNNTNETELIQIILIALTTSYQEVDVISINNDGLEVIIVVRIISSNKSDKDIIEKAIEEGIKDKYGKDVDVTAAGITPITTDYDHHDNETTSTVNILIISGVVFNVLAIILIIAVLYLRKKKRALIEHEKQLEKGIETIEIPGVVNVNEIMDNNDSQKARRNSDDDIFVDESDIPKRDVEIEWKKAHVFEKTPGGESDEIDTPGQETKGETNNE